MSPRPRQIVIPAPETFDGSFFRFRPCQQPQLLRMRNHQLVQQHMLRGGEEDRVHPDSQRQRSHSDGSKAGAPGQHA